MITANEAKEIAVQHIENENKTLDSKTLDSIGKAVLMEEKTEEKGYGWIFFYCSEKYEKTKHYSDDFIGGGPILVMKKDGELHQFGSGKTLEEWLKPFERKHKLSKLNPFH